MRHRAVLHDPGLGANLPIELIALRGAPNLYQLVVAPAPRRRRLPRGGEGGRAPAFLLVWLADDQPRIRRVH